MTPEETVKAFIACINQRNIDALLALMTENHVLKVMDEPEIVGKANQREPWQRYLDAFPRYIIHPHRFAPNPGGVAFLGHTIGSHLGLPDEEESKQTLIWNAGVRDGKVSAWVLLPDTPKGREVFRLGDNAAPSGFKRRSGRRKS